MVERRLNGRCVLPLISLPFFGACSSGLDRGFQCMRALRDFDFGAGVGKHTVSLRQLAQFNERLDYLGECCFTHPTVGC